jgi:hypothetical protein
MPQLLGAASCCFGGQRSFRIGRLTRTACRLDEMFERGIGPGVLQARDRQLDMHRRLERPVADPGPRQLCDRGRHQRHPQSGRDEAEAKLRIAHLRYLRLGAGPERHHHRPVGRLFMCRPIGASAGLARAADPDAATIMVPDESCGTIRGTEPYLIKSSNHPETRP